MIDDHDWFKLVSAEYDTSVHKGEVTAELLRFTQLIEEQFAEPAAAAAAVVAETPAAVVASTFARHPF